MKARDVMSTRVITVSQDTTVAQCASLMLEHGVSGLPVLDGGGKLVGMVSEGDLLHRAEVGTERPPRSWWLRVFTTEPVEAREYVKSHGRRASDVMTRKVVSVDPDVSLAAIALELESNRIKRVPVVQNGQVVGIVSRANLLHGLAARQAATGTGTPAPADDASLREKVIAAIEAEPWSTVATINIVVTSSVVEAFGIAASSEEREAFRVAAQNVPGVKRVIDHRLLTSEIPVGS